VSNHILKDHLLQISNILFNRLIDMSHQPSAQLMGAYGIIVDQATHQVKVPDELSINDRAGIISKIVGFNHHHGFTGSTWNGLGAEFVKLCRTPDNLNQRILAIDKIYNLLHHGGQLTDYMDESDWIEDALNFRDNANPAQIFSQASPDVRAIIGRGSYVGQDRGNVGDLQKLFTACRRASVDKPGIECTLESGILKLVINFSNLLWTGKEWPDMAGKSAPWVIYGDKPCGQGRAMIDAGYVEQGPRKTTEIVVTDKGTHLEVYSNQSSVEVKKPINRQYNLAQDLIRAAISAMNGPLRVGSSISNIKPSYYSKQGRRVKL
jgi:hypothetical protein